MTKGLALDGYIAERAFNTPLLIEPSKARMIANFLEQRFRMKGTFATEMLGPDYLARTKEKESPGNKIEGIAVLPIIGTLVHRAGAMDAESGMVSYQQLQNDLIELANDVSVKAIILDVASGGGECDGCFELAALIREINDTVKPVVSIANGFAYSAAYAIACAAGKMFMTETAGVGSIGVIVQHVDFSRANEMMGVKITNITAGDRKAELSNDFPLSPEAKEMLQSRVDMIGDIFLNHVSQMRNVSVEEIKATEAALLFGENAVNINLVDGIISFDALIEGLLNTELSAGTPDINKRIEAMSLLKKKDKVAASADTTVPEKKPDDAPAADPAPVESPAEDAPAADPAPEAPSAADAVERAAMISDACAAANMSAFSSQYIRSSMSLEQVKAEVDKANGIRQACKLAGKSDRADAFIKSGTSLKVVQDTLVSEMSAAQVATDVSPTPDPKAAAEDALSAKNFIAADAERRVAAAAAKNKQGDKK